MKTKDRTIENAPEPLRRRLKALKKRGLLDDPEVKRTIIDTALEVMEELRRKQVSRAIQETNEQN